MVELDRSRPFTAARARNAGFERLKAVEPDVANIQFVDGDCEVDPQWPTSGVRFLHDRGDVGAVCGVLCERHPNLSVYNWLCSREWNGPIGEIRSCAGNVLMRSNAFEQVGGYRVDILAAEEDELSLRLRAAGWKIWRVDTRMAIHDANMTEFRQWWRRTVRAGYAFAQGAYLHGAGPEKHFVWELRRAYLWGVFIPLACFASTLALWPWGSLSFLVYPLQLVRLIDQNSGSLRERASLSAFQLLARFPESWGQLTFVFHQFFANSVLSKEHK